MTSKRKAHLKRIGRILSDARVQQGMTYRDLVKASKINIAVVHRVLHGAETSFLNIVDLAKALKVELGELG